MLKPLYVSTARVARRIAGATGLLWLLERMPGRRALWFRSLFSIHDSADLVHLGIPWWTFPAIDAVEAHLAQRQGGARAFEYGSGASTIWLAQRCAIVRSVEHDAAFATGMARFFERHANIRLRTLEPEPATRNSKARSNRQGFIHLAFDSYAAAIEDSAEVYDLIVIDGRARVACLNRALSFLAPGGIILFDNSDRREYRHAIERSGLRETKLRGLAPALPYPGQTSLLRHES